MYDAAVPVKVVKAKKHLLRNLFHERHRYATVIPPFYQAKQVLAQHLEHHTNMNSIGSFVLERIEKTDDVSASWMVGIRLYDFIQEFDFVDCRLCVMRR